MAAAKNAEITKKEKKQTKEYKVIGKRFTDKAKANTELKDVFKKGFKGAGLMVAGNEFVILFGTYTTEQIANANKAAVEKAGFVVEIAEQRQY